MLQPTRLISTPFAQEGDKTEIQNVTGEFDNSATYRLGFPPLTMQSIRLGGKPPKGTDFNGVLFDITENISFLCKGGRYQYNAGLSTLIGGYPEGSNLLLDDNVTEVVSAVAGNQNNPNTDMTGWTFKPNRTTAEYVLDASGETQQQVNYNGGAKWHSRVGGYQENERVVLTNGDIVKSTIDGNTADPNVDMTGWVNPEYEQNLVNQLNYDKNLNLIDFFTESEKSQYEADPLTFDIKRPLQEAVDSTKNLSTKISFPPRYFNLKNPILITQDNIEIDLGGASLEYTGAPLTAAIQVKGTAGSDMGVLSDIDQYATSFTLSTEDAMTLLAGDYVKISTSENYFVIAGRDYKKGEIVQVESVSGGVVSIAGNGFQLAYSASSEIKAKKLNLIDKFNLTGGKLYGTGTNNRQTLLLAEYARKVCINGVDASASEVGVIFRSVVGGTVVLSYMHDIDRGGTGYAVSVEGASQHIIVSQNNFKRNRHSFTTGGYDGVCMNILVSDNIADDHNAGAVFNTHGNARFTDFKHNIITDALIGISCYSPCNNIVGNTMSNIKQSAVYQTEAGGINSRVNGNTIDGCSIEFFAAIAFTSRVTECETNRYVECNDNTIVNCQNGTGIGTSFLEAAAFPEIITANGNTIRDYGFEAILLKGGLVTTVAGNTIYRGFRSTNYAIDIENRLDTTGHPYGNVINLNGNNIGRAGYGISVTNAALLNYSANTVRATNAYRLTLSNVTTLQGDVLRSPDGTLYKMSVANGGALSTVSF